MAGLVLALGGWACGGSSPADEHEDGLKQGTLIAGKHHTCGVTAGGELWCWGRGSYGELGQGTTSGSSVPVKALLTDVREVSVATQSTCARKTDGTTWCWGRIVNGNAWPAAVQVNDLGADAVQLASYDSAVVALKKDGSLWSLSVPEATQLHDSTVGATLVAQGNATCFIKSDGSLWCEGPSNEEGQLGNGTTEAVSGPVAVSLPGKAKHVAANSRHACAVVEDGSVWCWGENSAGETGRNPGVSSPDCAACTPAPNKVQGLPARAVAVAAGYEFSLALLEDGSIWGWGANGYNQLGAAGGPECPTIGVPVCTATPFKVPLDKAVSVSAGDDHACACTEDGTAWCWGDSSSGVLGFPSSSTNRGTPPGKVSGFRCR